MNDSTTTASVHAPITHGGSHSPSLYPYEARVVLACFWVLFTLMGLLGGSLVLLAVLLSRKLRTPTNALVVNLSVADLWSTLSYPWMAAASLARHDWPLPGNGQWLCALAAAQFQIGLATSLYVLAAIALNRWVIVTRSRVAYRRLFAPRNLALMVAATWLVPCLVVLVPPARGVGSLGYDHATASCTDVKGQAGAATYSLVQTLGIYPVPMLLIVVSYASLYAHIRRHFKAQRDRSTGRSEASPEAATVETTDEDLEEEGKDARATRDRMTVEDVAAFGRRESKRQQRAITKNLFLLCCVFVVCVSPYYLALAVPGSERATAYLAVLSTVNSCINPVLYTVNHPHFKLVIRKIVLCRFAEIPEPSPQLKYLLSLRAP